MRLTIGGCSYRGLWFQTLKDIDITCRPESIYNGHRAALAVRFTCIRAVPSWCIWTSCFFRIYFMNESMVTLMRDIMTQTIQIEIISKWPYEVKNEGVSGTCARSRFCQR